MGEYFSFTLVDAYGRTTSKRVEVEPQALLGDYQTLCSAVVADIQAVTDLGLVRAEVTIPMTDTFAVTAGANVDTGATFSGWVYGTPGKKASWKLPGIKPAKVEADGTVDITEADIEDVLERFLQASGDLLLSDGEQISSWISGALDK